MLEKYLIVEDKKGNLSIVSNQEYRKENDNRLKWDPISGSDEMEEAEKTLAHIKAHFEGVPVLICDKIKPDDDAKDAIEWLSKLSYESIAVVCHMNVVGHIAEQLTHENFNPFALAEARIYDQAVIATGLSTQKNSFIPTI